MFRYYLRLLSVPLSLLALYISLFIVWEIFDLPAAQELGQMVKEWFGTYGLPALFISSIIEGGLLIGSYFPGVFVIFIGITLADSIAEAAAAVAVATVGLYIAHCGNYILGKYGWYRLLVKFGLRTAIERTKEKLEARGPIAIFSSYWLPSAGALTDTAAGIMHMPFRTFLLYSLAASIFWNTLVGTLVYVLGDKALVIAAPGSGEKSILAAIIAIWVIILLVVDFFQRWKNGGYLKDHNKLG